MGHAMECIFLFPNYQLFSTTPDSDLADFAAEMLAFIDRHGELLPMIDADLDAYGLRKKAQRARQRQAARAVLPALPALLSNIPEAEPSVAPRTLETGRPRMPALVVFLFLLMRGRYGSVSDQDACERFCEYKTIEAVLSPRGLRLPSRQALVDNLNAVTNATRQAILDAQLQDCLTEELDDFKEICIDSTAVCANSAFPNDASLAARSLQRAFIELWTLRKLGVVTFTDGWMPTWKDTILSLARDINMARGKKAPSKRRKLYRKMLDTMDKAMAPMKELYKTLFAEDAAQLAPQLQAKRERHLIDGVQALVNAWKAGNQIRRRVFNHEAVPMDEKLLSLADADAALIIKGDRETVLGYRPGLARSRAGFIVDLALDKGNTADSGVLVKTIEAVAGRVGAVPEKITTDDGYASQKNREAALKLGVKLITFSGAKGKKITPAGEWDSAEAIEQRARRSAVESLMAVMKDGYFFARMRRCGLENVRAEMLEKIIAYNVDRILMVRARKAKEAQEQEEKMRNTA